ncbi:MAG: lipopolysaccharide biosynthesis protein [Steroidobacteraceae bacterium]
MTNSLYDRGKARRSLFDTVAYRLISQVTTVLGYIVLVRAMRKQDFGVFNLLYSFIPLVGTVASLGLEQTLRRFQPEYLREGNRSAAAWLVSRVARARLLTNVTILVGLLAAWNSIAPHFGLGPYRVEFEVFAVVALLHFQTQILQLSVASYMLHRYSVGSIAMLSFSKLVLYFGLVAAGMLTLRTAICADAVGYAVIYVFLRIVYHRQCVAGQPPERYELAPEERKRLFRYGLFNNFNDAGTLFLDSRMDNFFIVGFMNAISVGIYSFYTRLNEMATNVLPVRLFDNIIQPMFFAVKPAEADTRLPQYFTFLLNINLLVQWPILAYSVVYHAEIVRVAFAGKFIEYSWLLPVILGFSTLNSFATPVALVAQYEEKTAIQLLSKIFAGYNIVAMLVLIPHLGLYGAALASGSAQAFKNAFVWWHVRRRAVWINAGSSLFTSVATWGAAVAVCFTLKNLQTGTAGMQLFLGTLIFACFALLYVRSRALCDSDRDLLMRLFPGREMRWLRFLGLFNPTGGVSGAH